MVWRRLGGILIALGCLGIGGCGVTNFNRTLSPEEIDKVAREITVIVDGCGGGSGVLYKREGDTYSVLTANHVINEKLTCSITTPDGKKYEAAKEITRPIQGLDLAILKFTSNTGYKLAELGDSTQLKGSEPIYVAGAPGIDEVTLKRAIRVNQGNLLSDTVKSGVEGLDYLMLYNTNTLPGMSGGTVLTVQGKVVGVHVIGDYYRTKASTGVNGGVPIHILDPSKYTIQTIDEAARSYFEASLERDPDKAIEKYTKVIQLKPNNAILYFVRGFIYAEKGDSDKAIADYNQAISLNPKFPYSYNNRGLIYAEKGETDKAFADYNQAIKLDFTYAAAYNNRGLIYSEKGETDKALADYNQAVKLDFTNASAYNNRGGFYAEKGDEDKALADFNQAIKLDFTNASAYNNRGSLYAKKGEKDKALADYNQAIKLDFTHVAAYNNRGNIYGDKGDYQNALFNFSEAIKLNPQDVKAYVNRAALRGKIAGEQMKQSVRNGEQNIIIDTEEALADLKEAIRLKPDYADAYIVRARLNLLDRESALADLQKAASLYQQQGNKEGYQEALELMQTVEDFFRKFGANRVK